MLIQIPRDTQGITLYESRRVICPEAILIINNNSRMSINQRKTYGREIITGKNVHYFMCDAHGILLREMYDCLFQQPKLGLSLYHGI